MGKSKIAGGGSLGIMDAVINKYLSSGEKIGPSTFISFIDSYAWSEIDNASVSGTSPYLTTYSTAEKIDSSRVLVASQNSNNAVVAYIVSFNGSTVSVGTGYSLGTAGLYKIKKLSDNKLVVIRGGTSVHNYLYGLVLTVSGTTIKAGKSTRVCSHSIYSYGNVNAGLFDFDVINPSKILIAEGAESSSGSISGYLYAQVCTISGTDISAGPDYQLTSETYADSPISVTALETKTLITHNAGGASGGRLGCMIVSVSSDSVTKISDTDIGAGNVGSVQSSIALSGSRALLVSSDYIGEGSSAKRMCFGQVIQINQDDSVSVGSRTILEEGDVGRIQACVLDSGRFLVSLNAGVNGTWRNTSIVVNVTNLNVSVADAHTINADTYNLGGNATAALDSETFMIFPTMKDYYQDVYVVTAILDRKIARVLDSSGAISGITISTATATRRGMVAHLT